MARQHETELTDSEFEEYLDEVYDEVSICGITYSSGYALRLLDPTAFRCAKSNHEDYIDSKEPKWECDICDELHDSEEEADECCKDDDESTSIEAAPACWASYLINADSSGLTEDEIEAADAWVKTLGEYRVTDVQGESYFGRHRGIGCSLIDYVCYRTPKP